MTTETAQNAGEIERLIRMLENMDTIVFLDDTDRTLSDTNQRRWELSGWTSSRNRRN